MKAILLIITLAASASCAMPTAAGTDFVTGQTRLGGRAAVTSSSDTPDGSGYVLFDVYAFDAGVFFTDQLELGATVETLTSSFLNDAQLYTGFARYYLKSEGNVRPFVLAGAGLYKADDGSGDVYRLGAGVSQYISESTSFELYAENQFSSYVTDPPAIEKESDALNIYFGVNIFL
ncbi:MAG: hypothetical protein P8L98_06600 [Planctomycetota bacterium]|jgi:hypothetical protein|nr:hypothetical protein [Planctomycetota bacterium]